MGNGCKRVQGLGGLPFGGRLHHLIPGLSIRSDHYMLANEENPDMSSTSDLPSISLYFREGGSDKEYHAHIDAKDGGFLVNFAYGKRGAALTIGTKTSSPTSREAAVKIYEKLVAEKMAKGYTPSTDGKAFAMTEKAGDVSGLLPQLLNAIEEAEVERYLSDDAWVMEEKHDGRRLMVRVASGGVEAANRKGLVVVCRGRSKTRSR